MELTLDEAADYTGRTKRQIRYLIQKNLVPARKVKGKWLIPKGTLDLTRGMKSADAHKKLRAEGIAGEVFRSSGAKKGKRWSVQDLRAYTTARTILADLKKTDETSLIQELLLESMVDLCCGCHTFHPAEKVAFFGRAREKACRAVVFLHEADQTDLAASMEQQLIPAISGLIRRAEGRKRK